MLKREESQRDCHGGKREWRVYGGKWTCRTAFQYSIVTLFGSFFREHHEALHGVMIKTVQPEVQYDQPELQSQHYGVCFRGSGPLIDPYLKRSHIERGRGSSDAAKRSHDVQNESKAKIILRNYCVVRGWEKRDLLHLESNRAVKRTSTKRSWDAASFHSRFPGKSCSTIIWTNQLKTAQVRWLFRHTRLPVQLDVHR